MSDKTIRLPFALWQSAKIAAAERGESLKAFLEAAVEARLHRVAMDKAELAKATPVEFVGVTDGRG